MSLRDNILNRRRKKRKFGLFCQIFLVVYDQSNRKKNTKWKSVVLSHAFIILWTGNWWISVSRSWQFKYFIDHAKRFLLKSHAVSEFQAIYLKKKNYLKVTKFFCHRLSLWIIYLFFISFFVFKPADCIVTGTNTVNIFW